MQRFGAPLRLPLCWPPAVPRRKKLLLTPQPKRRLLLNQLPMLPPHPLMPPPHLPMQPLLPPMRLPRQRLPRKRHLLRSSKS